VFKDSPPEDIWPDPDEEFGDDKDRLIGVNLYRLTLMHYGLNQNPNLLGIAPIAGMDEVKFSVGNLQTKFLKSFFLRKIRRKRVPYKEDPLNWRRNYKVKNIYKTSHCKEFEVPNFDYKRLEKATEKSQIDVSKAGGSDLLVSGGLAIMKNAFDEKSIK